MDSMAHKFSKHEPDASELKDADDYLSEYGRKPPRLIYEILSARSDGVLAAFATFDLALAYYRGYCAAVRRVAYDPMAGIAAAPRVVSTDRHDGSEDGNYGGLSEDERNAIEEAG